MAEHEPTLVRAGDLMIRLLEVEAALEKEIAARNAAIDSLYRSILLGSQTDGSTAIRNPNVFDGTGASFYRAVYGLNAENRTRIWPIDHRRCKLLVNSFASPKFSIV